MSGRIPLTAIVLTHNEELNLPACLESLRGCADRIIVVDSDSTDRTHEIARAAGAALLLHPFSSHAAQWQWALAQSDPAEWVLCLDADQALTAELRTSLEALFTGRDPRLQSQRGFFVNRRQIFRGQWIRHGGYYPKYLLKLFRRDAVRFDPSDLVDHHFHVAGPTALLSGDLLEQNRKEDEISFWLQKHVRYAELHAREELLRNEVTTAANDASPVIEPDLFGSPDQRTAWLKRRWYTLPRYWRGALYFFYRYFIRLGFLDGRQGFLFHFLQTFWLRVIVDANLDQLEQRRGQYADTRH